MRRNGLIAPLATLVTVAPSRSGIRNGYGLARNHLKFLDLDPQQLQSLAKRPVVACRTDEADRDRLNTSSLSHRLLNAADDQGVVVMAIGRPVLVRVA